MCTGISTPVFCLAKRTHMFSYPRQINSDLISVPPGMFNDTHN